MKTHDIILLVLFVAAICIAPFKYRKDMKKENVTIEEFRELYKRDFWTSMLIFVVVILNILSRYFC